MNVQLLETKCQSNHLNENFQIFHKRVSVNGRFSWFQLRAQFFFPSWHKLVSPRLFCPPLVPSCLITLYSASVTSWTTWVWRTLVCLWASPSPSPANRPAWMLYVWSPFCWSVDVFFLKFSFDFYFTLYVIHWIVLLFLFNWCCFLGSVCPSLCLWSVTDCQSIRLMFLWSLSTKLTAVDFIISCLCAGHPTDVDQRLQGHRLWRRGCGGTVERSHQEERGRIVQHLPSFG